MGSQIFLTRVQRRRVGELAASRGLTLAEVVRLAVDEFVEKQTPNVEPVLASTFGAVPDFAPPSRDEWDRG